jgi:hypothetical protein
LSLAFTPQSSRCWKKYRPFEANSEISRNSFVNILLTPGLQGRFRIQYASGQDPLTESLVHPLSQVVGPDLSLACRRVRLAAAHAIDVQAINEAERLGFSRLTGSIVPQPFDFAMAIWPPALCPTVMLGDFVSGARGSVPV